MKNNQEMHTANNKQDVKDNGRRIHTGSAGLRTRRTGSTLVEFALIVPVLLALLIGIIEFGWLVKNNHTVANATREGARFASLGKSTSATQDRVRYAAAPITVANTDITLEYFNSATNLWLPWPADTTTGNAVPVDSQIRVTVKVRHQQLTGFFPFLRNRAIVQFTVMRREL